MLRLLAIVLAFIIYGSLYPFHFDFGRTEASPLLILLHAWPAKIDRFAWRDAGVNILLYFPLGLTAVLVLTRRLPRAAAASSGCRPSPRNSRVPAAPRRFCPGCCAV